MRLHHFEYSSPDGTGEDATLKIDGVEIKNPHSITLDVNPVGHTTVVVEFVVSSTDFDTWGRFVPLLFLDVNEEEEAVRELYERLKMRFDDN